MTDESFESTFAQTRAYLDHRKALIDLGNESLRTFDRAILVLSSGALGLSVVFLKDIVGLGPVEGTGYLFASWGLFMIAIIVNILSYLASWKDAQTERVKVDECATKGTLYLPGNNPYRLMTVWANSVALVCFVGAVTCLASFAFRNVGTS